MIYKTHKFLYMYILQGNSSGQEIRVHFFTNVQIQICNPKTDIFRSFTKIQKCIVDPNDPQLRWILWIIFKTTYFGYMIRRVSLLWIQKEWILIFKQCPWANRPDYRGGSRGRVQGVHTPPPPEMTCSFLIQLVFCKKKIGGLLVLK